MKTPRFHVGHQFISRSNRKRKLVDTVVDILTTTNIAGEIVDIEYKTVHEFCGQPVTGRCHDTTIALGETISNGITI